MKEKFRNWLHRKLGIHWWEELGYCTNPEEGTLGGCTVDVRRCKICKQHEALELVADGGWTLRWVTMTPEEVTEMLEALEGPSELESRVESRVESSGR